MRCVVIKSFSGIPFWTEDMCLLEEGIGGGSQTDIDTDIAILI